MPMTMPTMRCRHGAGNARMAASSTSVASTPLQPASIDTAKPLVALRITLPLAITLGSNSVTIDVEIAASAFVHGTTKYSWAHGVSSSANSTASRRMNTRKKRAMARFYGVSSLLPVVRARGAVGRRHVLVVQRLDAQDRGSAPRGIARRDLRHGQLALAQLGRRESHVFAAKNPKALVGKECASVVGCGRTVQPRDDRLQQSPVVALLRQTAAVRGARLGRAGRGRHLRGLGHLGLRLRRLRSRLGERLAFAGARLVRVRDASVGALALVDRLRERAIAGGQRECQREGDDHA